MKNEEILNLKELLNQKIDYEKKLTDLQFQLTEQALVLQKVETDRRLHDLNGEADRLKEMQKTYPQREVFDNTIKEINEKLENLRNVDTGVKNKTQGFSIGQSTIFAIVGTIGVILTIILNVRGH